MRISFRWLNWENAEKGLQVDVTLMRKAVITVDGEPYTFYSYNSSGGERTIVLSKVVTKKKR